jgi:hypothetical protein
VIENSSYISRWLSSVWRNIISWIEISKSFAMEEVIHEILQFIKSHLYIQEIHSPLGVHWCKKKIGKSDWFLMVDFLNLIPPNTNENVYSRKENRDKYFKLDL